MKYAKIELENISEMIDPFAIKNFIISDKAITPRISFEHPFILDGIAFILCIKGSGRFKINFREYDVCKNSIMTIMPFFVTEVLEKSVDMTLVFLVFSTDFLSEVSASNKDFDISESIIRTPCLQVTQEEVDNLLDFHSFIVKQYKRRDHPYRKEMVKGLLYGLLTEIGGIYFEKFIKSGEKEKKQPTSRQEEIVSKFFRLLLDNHQKEKTLQFYAGKMFLTPKYLSTTLKERTGRTAMDWINEALIASGKYLLKTTDLTVAQIAEEMNFPNPSFFGRFFKKHTGATPLEYKGS